MNILSVTYDPSADLKKLKKLEREGFIDIHAVSIEQNAITRSLKRKEKPIAVIDGSFSYIDDVVIASNDTPYKEIETIIGCENHGDVLHFERHVESGRDIFVTEDKHFLATRDTLMKRFNTRIMTLPELEAELR